MINILSCSLKNHKIELFTFCFLKPTILERCPACCTLTLSCCVFFYFTVGVLFVSIMFSLTLASSLLEFSIKSVVNAVSILFNVCDFIWFKKECCL